MNNKVGNAPNERYRKRKVYIIHSEKSKQYGINVAFPEDDILNLYLSSGKAE